VELRAAFGIGDRVVATLVGGGGKTSLLFALAREGVAAGRRVVTATTTKMLLPEPHPSSRLVVGNDERKLLADLDRALARTAHVTVGRTSEGAKLGGVSTDFVGAIAAGNRADWILVEGDGAKHRHLKAPRPGEPVVPACTDLLVPVVGIDVVGRPFTAETVFRPEIVERITPYRRGETVTVAFVHDVLFHERGVCASAPPGARVLPFVSFVDGPRELARARELAALALARRPFGVTRLVLGNADPGRVVEVAGAHGSPPSPRPSRW